MEELLKLKQIIDSIPINLIEKDIINFLKIKKRWPYKYTWGQPSVEIIPNQTTNNQNILFYDIDGYLNFERWEYFYNLWFTTIISNVLDLNDDLRFLQKKITEETGLDVNGNFYFSKPGKKASFDAHKHEYNVLVKQIYGQSKWKINEETFIMEPQNSCIIPKNSIHQVIDKNENKLSLTINLI